MDSGNHKVVLKVAVWAVVLIGLIVTGCRFIVPRQHWNEAEWGPLVPHTQFPGDCSLCHVPERWDRLRPDFTFDHAKETGYALEGAHAQAMCLRCHNDRGPVEAYVERGCAGCHLDLHESTLGLDCERCHSQTDWNPQGLVAEHARTRFPLIGTHAVASCESCHEGAAAGEFRGAPLQCEVCHVDDYTATTDPNHVANGWIMDCQRCHNEVSWSGGDFQHAFFPLTGGHGGLNCIECHTTPGDFTSASQDCFTCHDADYQTAPSHIELGFPQDCTECHSTRGWSPAAFDHSFFPLTGEHAGLSCMECHTGGGFTGVPSDCIACHDAEFQSAPNHVAENYPLTCEQCHTPSGWSPASFDHSIFALSGGHAGLQCTDCHSSGVYEGLPSDCISCHDAEYQAAPSHADLNFSQDCTQCHSVTAWTPAAVDHSFFPLTQGHFGLDCAQCHDPGTFTGLSQDCYSCHDADFAGAPSHVELAFSHDCEQCHTRAAWTPATFDHAFFPLNGGHAGLLCSQCHEGGTYTGLSSDCYACHDTDYQGADNHASLSFQHDCTECHTLTSWTPSTFQHGFPTGHRGATGCVICHDSGSAYVFSCFNCHPHSSQSETDSHHREMNGYSYNSQACYNCHPNGRD